MSGANSSNIKVIVGFDDRALAGIPGANKRIESLETSAGRASKGILSLNTSGSAAKLEKGMRGVARESLSAFENMAKIMGPLEVITGAASVAGLARLSSEWAGLTTQLGYSAQRAGIGVNQLNQLQGAATLAGVSADALTSGMTALNDNLTNAATGRAPEAVAAFNFLHVAIRDANGQLRSSTQVLPELADHLAAIKNPAIQAQLATELLGGSAEQLLPFLRQGSAGIAELSQEAASYGTKTAKDVAIAQKFTHQQGELTLAIGGLANTLSEKYLPGLGDAEAGLAHFISANKDAVADGIGVMTVALTAFSTYLSGKFLKGVTKSLLGDLPGLVKQAYREVPQEIADAQIANDVAADVPAGRKGPGAGLHSGFFAGPVGWALYTLMNGLPDVPDSPQLREQFPGFNRGTGQSHPARISSQETADNLATSRKFFLDHGWGPAATAGILSSEYSESRFNPGAVGDNGTSLGIFQWHNDRAAQMEAWAKANNLDPKALSTQLQFTQWDLTDGPHSSLGDTLRNTKDPVQAGTLWTSQYEKPAGGDAEAIRRGEAAVQFLQWPGAASPSAGLPQSKEGAPVDGAGNAPKGAYRPALISPHEPSGPAAAGPEANITPSAPAANIADGTGASSAASSETTVKGSATVTVKLQGAPPGTRTSATSDGELFASAGPVRIEKSAVGQGIAT